MRTKSSLEPLITAIKNSQRFVTLARHQVDGSDPDNIEAIDLTDARSQLSDASNAIDDAMGEIDKLLAPVRTREEMHDA